MKIPVNLITGFLGVGKTTAVRSLLARKPADEYWAVIVNEYGEVPIDGAILEAEGTANVTVREISGGCMCCASAPYLPVTIHFLLTERRPDRILIETTGLGHPARLIDTLRGRPFDAQLDMRAVTCIVDPADFARPEMRDSTVFLDQMHLADVLALNKIDRTPPELIESFRMWAEAQYPPKALIVGTTFGNLDATWLDLASDETRQAIAPKAHEHFHVTEPLTFEIAPPGRPLRKPSPTGDACGWIFSAADQFDEERLLELLQNQEGITRLKGVFRVADDERLLIQRVDRELRMEMIPYRRDSRVEAFGTVDWRAFEASLRDLIL